MQGITAVLLSLKKKPIIRYERMSSLAKKLGGEVLVTIIMALFLSCYLMLPQHKIQSEAPLFDFRLTQVPPLLLILDRRNDPVTPLLSQWTYQAMVHELLNIQNGRVDLSLVPDIRPELRVRPRHISMQYIYNITPQEITLTTQTDPFFASQYLSTFGDLGSSLKTYVQSYQSRTISPSAINSISDMKRFVEEYPEFRKLGGNVSKHVALVGELSRIVGRDQLLEVGEVEQGLATASGADLKVGRYLSVLKVLITCDVCRVYRLKSPTRRFRQRTSYALSSYTLCDIKRRQRVISRLWSTLFWNKEFPVKKLR